ncbi:MAG: flippase-like domain-containing protein [Odoribacteraceae bacterium]|jgi:uncharacterized membrane protein YbhN (UPF0104 family)|nr:flippase-like domain-containing protein [Odoribacteraceae bacterium]
MNSFYKQLLKFFLFFLVTVFLFWLVYRDQDPAGILKMLREDVNYSWIVLAIVLGIASHVSRAMRWQLLVRSMDYRITFWNSFMGVMIGYFANMAIPRMGELTRCGVVHKYERVPFSKLLGTVVVERVIDVLVLLSLTLVVIGTQFGRVRLFMETHEEIQEKVSGILSSGWVWGGGIVLLLLLALLVWLTRRGVFSARARSFFSGIKEGLLAVRAVPRVGWFVFHTLFIWLMYFLMLYVCFFSFEFTSCLGPMAGLTVFVLSSYGMVAPVQGGVGAWHFMVIAALALYLPATGEVESLAKTFALLTHGAMTVLYIFLGVSCLLCLPVYNRKR